MTKKKIIFVNRFFFPDHSATAQILTDLAFDLAAEHRDVLVITTRGLYDDPACVLARWQSINGVEIQRVYRPRFGRNRLLGRAMDYLAMHLSFTLAVAKGARKGDVIVAKTDPPMLSIPFLLIAVIKRAKLINWLQDIYPEVAVAWKAPFSRTVATALTPVRDVSLRRAHKNVVVGERSRAFLRQRGVAEEKIHVVHNWCDDEAIDPAHHEANRLRAEWRLEGKFIIAYSGNLGRAHECKTILDAARRLRAQDDIVFLFIGGGALLPQLIEDVRKHQLQSTFRFQPYQPHDTLHVSLTLPDILWMSLRPDMEGFIVPSKFYGACAAGRPLIFIGDTESELAALIEENGCGAAVSPGNDAGLSKLILEFKADRKKLEAMGRNARALLEARFTRRAALQKWRDILPT